MSADASNGMLMKKPESFKLEAHGASTWAGDLTAHGQNVGSTLRAIATWVGHVTPLCRRI